VNKIHKFVIDAGLKIGNEEERIYPVLVLGPNDGALSAERLETIRQFYKMGVYMVRVVDQPMKDDIVEVISAKLYCMLFQDKDLKDCDYKSYYFWKSSSSIL
jgi:hypothetical protein